MREIAALVGSDGEIAPYLQAAWVIVYRRMMAKWESDREMAFIPDQSGSLKGLRTQVRSIVEFLGECKILISPGVTGVPFFELEKAGCSVYELIGRPTDHLEEVWEQEEEEKKKETSSSGLTIPVPRETTPGRFSINIKEIQEQNAEITSKQILQSFVRRGAFDSLEIVCNHVPPWIELDATNRGYISEAVQNGPGLVTVILTRASI